MRRLLLLDDEIHVLHALQRTLRGHFPRHGLVIELFTEPEEALLRCAEVAFDAVISDYRMLAMNGIDFLKMVKGIQPDAVRLVLSGSTEFTTVMNAINMAEVFRFIAKPWEPPDLTTALELAFARRDQLKEDRRLADEMRAQRGILTPQELAAKRLEEEEPGITRVKWGRDGSVLLD